MDSRQALPYMQGLTPRATLRLFFDNCNRQIPQFLGFTVFLHGSPSLPDG
jgi:hypothetical protein